MPTYQALMLDAFGTLVEGAEETFLRTSERIVSEHLPHVPPRTFCDRWWSMVYALDDEGFFSIAETHEISLRKLFQDYGLRAPVDDYIAMVDQGWAQAHLYPEVRGVLAQLEDYSICVVSNADEDFLLRLFERHGLHFSGVITSEFSRSYKPNTRMFRLALKALGKPRGSVLHVGDTLSADVVGAHRLGIPVAWVNRLGEAVGPTQAVPDFEIPDLQPLPLILQDGHPRRALAYPLRPNTLEVAF